MCVTKGFIRKTEAILGFFKLEEFQLREWEDCTAIGGLRQRGQGSCCLSSRNQNVGWAGIHGWLPVHLSGWFTGGTTQQPPQTPCLPSDFTATDHSLRPPKVAQGPLMGWTTLEHRGKGILENLVTYFPLWISEEYKGAMKMLHWQ